MHKTYSMIVLALSLASGACGGDLNRQTGEMPNSDPGARPPAAQSDIVQSELPVAQPEPTPTAEPTPPPETPEPEPQPAPPAPPPPPPPRQE
jgi:hypothetical protein